MAPIKVIQTEIDLGPRVAPVIVRVNRRARRLILKVDPVHGQVLITTPSKRALPEALAFARERRTWILDQLDTGPKARPFTPDASFPFQGAAHRIVLDGPPRARIRQIPPALDRPGEIIVGGEACHLNRRLTDWLKREARRVFLDRTDHYCALLERSRGTLRVTDGRTRWGSCSEDRTLSFSWRLILAPEWILNYVAAHECAHLVHLDHSRAYWTLLAGLDVDAKAARNWFDENGATLHAYGADPRERLAA